MEHSFKHLMYDKPADLAAIRLFPALLVLMLFYGCSGDRPLNLGVQDGKLGDCPSTPNCVSSFAKDSEHFITPLMFSAKAPEVMRRLKQILTTLPRVQIIREEEEYLYAEFTSLVFRFVDDVEFYFDSRTGTLHFRSASRLGKSDLGVNRERIDTIKQRLSQMGNEAGSGS